MTTLAFSTYVPVGDLAKAAPAPAAASTTTVVVSDQCGGSRS